MARALAGPSALRNPAGCYMVLPFLKDGHVVQPRCQTAQLITVVWCPLYLTTPVYHSMGYVVLNPVGPAIAWAT